MRDVLHVGFSARDVLNVRFSAREILNVGCSLIGFLSKVLELPAKDFVVYVKKNLTGKEKDLQKDLDSIWDKFK